MFLRFYLIIRNLFNHTEFSDPYAKLHCERYGFTAGSRFCFKCYLYSYPGTTVTACLTLSVFISSYIVRISERSTWKNYSGWDSVSPIQHIYMVIITMTTVGYGDYVPLTIIGKVVIVATALWGGFVIGLLIVSVNDIFNLSVTEKVAFDKLAKVRTAAKVIV